MKNNKILIIILLVASILISIFSVTYSYFTAKVKENNKTETNIKVQDLELEFNGVKEINVDSIVLGESFTKTFNVVNNSTSDLTYNIYMENINNTIGSDLVYSLTDDDKELVTNKAMPVTSDKKYLLKKLSIAAKSTVNYTMTVTLVNKEDEDQSAILGKSFSGTLGIDTKQVPTASSALKDSNEVMPSTILNFSQISSDSNGKGLYLLSSTKDDNYPIYFYRGAVTNNNLKFANYCWKIVRTTDTGGIKIIYNGLPNENGYCDNGSNSVNYIARSYFENYGSSQIIYKSSTGNNSLIKGIIDKWYFENLINYQSYLEDTKFCEEKGGTYGPKINSNDDPNLNCDKEYAYTVSTNDGNGLLDYPIALLNPDEVNMAGLGFSPDNYSYYLYTNIGFWMLGPADDNVGHFMEYSGRFQQGSTTNNLAVRPVVSLNKDVELSGSGTTNDPFVIVE